MYTAAQQQGARHAVLHTRLRRARRSAAAQALPSEHAADTQSRRALLNAGIVGAALSLAAPPPAAHAGLLDYDVRGKGLKTFELSLGRAEDNAFVFVPSELSFEAGTLVKLKMVNPSKVEHYFSAPQFASKVFSVLVEVNGVEVKGPVGELALAPGAQLEWTFVPMRKGTYQLLCPVNGHVEAGMVGALTITPAR